jgi:type I restriction enzyme M protein
MFHGFDFDATMLRIASMNLMLHGVDNPDIHYQDTLSIRFSRSSQAGDRRLRRHPRQPALQGQLDEGDVHLS